MAKILLAFAGGVAIASGLFLWVGREAPAPEPPPPVAEIQQPEAAPPDATPPEPAAPPPVPEPAPVQRAAVKPKPKPRVVVPVAQTPAPAPVTQPQAELPPLEPLPAAATPAPPPTPIAEANLPDPEPVAVPSIPPPIQTVTLREGTLLSVRLEEALSSERNQPGDAFRASLDEPLVIDGWVIAERGARVLGRVRDLESSGRVKGLASITLELVSLEAADGQRVDLRTAGFVHKARESKKSDAVKVGVMAAIGAAIGAAAGGGKGAAIGAASGGAAGAGAVVLTKGDAATLDTETRIRFRVDRSVEITERR